MQKKFSYPVKIDELNQNSYKFILEADSEELQDITEVLQVEAVKFFHGEVFLKFIKRDNLLRVWGNVAATLTIKSVISLENFEQKIETPFELFFDTKATYKDIREMEPNINDEVPDIVENGEINLADICIEQVALKMDDYPRAEGEVFDFAQYAKVEPLEHNNPFAVLKNLKK
ncbi:MAG: DUF177 domain-containing protein [Alphaproteobacteria bacterium]|nr:DUF177 domain-containing protein [Alphaproteobacteria bacterium]